MNRVFGGRNQRHVAGEPIRVLNHVNDTLGKVTFGVRAIAHQTEPVTEIVTAINNDLGAVAGALEALVASVSKQTPSEHAA